jgi:hypothetical protein
MDSITITDPNDQSFPFSRTIFEDQCVLYHGTWSTWSSRIEAEGFIHTDLPFDWQHVATVFQANQAIGRGSFLWLFLGERYPKQLPPRDLYLSANFWVARAYATDGGGEVVRKTIEEAEEFERICTDPQERAKLKALLEEGLRESPQHRPTQAAIKMLENDEALNQMHAKVKAAKDSLLDLTVTGHPIVYAIRVEPKWLGKHWKTHISSWEEGVREVDLPCCGDLIPPNRLVAKAIYPNSTDRDFMPTWCSTWEDVVALR